MKNTENPLQNIQTTDYNKERLQQLKQILPDIFTDEGNLNINELKKIINQDSVHETERYEFRWFGKSKAKRDAYTPTTATLSFDEKRSYNHQNTQNIIIEGENLATLKLLTEGYRNQIKCIYIDPPYNTGKDFVYSDNFNQDRKEYWEENQITEEGIKVDTNTDTDGRFHSNWLNMMFSRLLMARQLLREDGVIFISIDDNEVHHLRKLCDEVFGEENFVASVIWERAFSPINLKKHFSESHDYIICFAKNLELLENYGVARSEENDKNRYKNPDKDSRGDWTSSDMSVGPAIEDKIYEITTPNGNKVFPSNGRCWLFTKEKYQEMIKDNRIWFGKTGNNMPRVKKFLTEVKQGITPMTLWKYSEVGHSQDATQQLKSLFDDKDFFDYPKPTTLLSKVFQLYTSKNDLILDFFAGSGTTGQAVMELNAEDGGNRKFILVQIPEATEEKSEAFKAGYKKISAITIERNKRVAEKLIKETKEDATDEEKAKLGFKVFKLKKSSFPRAEFAPDPTKTDAENLALLENYISKKEAQLVTVFNKEELISEILIKNGFQLNYQLAKQEQFTKNEIFLVTDPHNSYNPDKQILICLDVTLAAETLDYFKTHIDKKLIVLERALDTTQKWNFKHYLGENFKAF